MRSIAIAALLTSAGACSLIVSFDDLEFQNDTGASGSAGVGGAGGEASTCDYGMAGNVGVFRTGAPWISAVSYQLLTAAADSQGLYGGGTTDLGAPFVVKLSGELQEAWLLIGDIQGNVTAIAADNEILFGGVKNPATQLALTNDSNITCTIPGGQVYFAAVDASGTNCVFIETLGPDTLNGRVSAAVILNQQFVFTGHGTGTLSFDRCETVSGEHHFIAGYDRTNHDCDWLHKPALGDTTNQETGIHAAIAHNGAVWIVGGYESAVDVDIGGCTLPASTGVDIFAAVLSDASCVAASAYPGSADELATALSADGTDGYIVGRYHGSPSLAGCAFPDGGTDAGNFVMKVTLDAAAGELRPVWTHPFATSSGAFGPSSVAWFGPNDLRVAGSYSGKIDFGGGPFDNPTRFKRIFAAKLDAATGEHIVSAQIDTASGDADDADDYVVAVSNLGANMILTGFFQGNTPVFMDTGATIHSYAVNAVLAPP